ncbi:MAG: type II toxin-antitoxin system HipA family toxin [Gammaproteobacteria bacterium]
MATDKHAVVWTRCGTAPIKMGLLTVTDTQCRFTYEAAFLASGLPGLGLLYAPSLVGTHTLTWQRNAYFNLLPQLQFHIPPLGEANFQRRLVLSYLEQQGNTPPPGFDSDWAILVTAGHGGVGHLDIFADDEKALAWYADKTTPAFLPGGENFALSLKDVLAWMDHDAHALLAALGPTPSVGGAIPKLLLSIPASGWDGRIGLPRRGVDATRIDVVLKFEKENYRGIVELEALALDVHAQAGFTVPRHWITALNGVPALAIERFDRDASGRPLFMETAYALMASGDARVTHHYSSSYDAIGRAFDRSPIPIVSHPKAAKLHLLKRLLLALVTGNGDLHLENLAFLRHDDHTDWSPIYDPTPMRAYSRHNMLAVMPFGNYGESDAHGRAMDFAAAVQHLAKGFGFARKTLRDLIAEVLTVTQDYGARIDALPTLPADNKVLLIGIHKDLSNKLRAI